MRNPQVFHLIPFLFELINDKKTSDYHSDNQTLYFYHCCPARIRTQTDRTRICSATITQRDSCVDGAKLQKKSNLQIKGNSFLGWFY